MPKRSKKTALFTLTHSAHGRTSTAALTADQIARTVDVSMKTARRWIDGTQSPSPQTLELLRIKVFGLLPDPAFTGFYSDNGVIHTPSGGALRPDDLDQLLWLRGLYYRGIQDNKSKQEEIEEMMRLLPRVDLIKRKLNRS